MRSIGTLLFLCAASPAVCADDACGQLFTVERNVNANVVVYEAVHGSDGRLDPKKPVRVFWLMKAEDGRPLALNFFERIRAYGVEAARGPSPGAFSLKMRAFPNRSLLLREREGCAEVLTDIDGRNAVLSRVFVSATRGLFPSVAYVDVFGRDSETGFALSERLDTSGRAR